MPASRQVINAKLKELNDDIGTEVALTLIRDAEYRDFSKRVTRDCFCPCIFIPISISKICNGESPQRKMDSELIHKIKKTIRNMRINKSEILSSNGILLQDKDLKKLQTKKLSLVHDALKEFNKLNIPSNKDKFKNLLSQFDQAMKAQAKTNVVEKELQDLQKGLGHR